MFKNIFTPLLDFIFPTSETTNSFESYPENMLKIFPAAKISNGFTCLFAYQNNSVKELVWEIKYYKNQKVAHTIGKLLAQKILEQAKRHESYTLVPIPQTPQRLNERGFNHTELIVDNILKYLPSNYSSSNTILKKIRNTPKQNSIEHREDRFKNIKDAFAITDHNAVKNKNIIIIDDVITTGATVNEAMKQFVAAQAKQITIFAIAH